jgi:hypothetical protein
MGIWIAEGRGTQKDFHGGTPSGLLKLQGYLEIKWSLSQFRHNHQCIPVRTRGVRTFQKSVSHIQFQRAMTRCKSYTKNTKMLGMTVQNFIARVLTSGNDAGCTLQPVWAQRQRRPPPGIEPGPLVVQVSEVTTQTDLPVSQNCRACYKESLNTIELLRTCHVYPHLFKYHKSHVYAYTL